MPPRFTTPAGLQAVSAWHLAFAQIAGIAVFSSVVAIRSNAQLQQQFAELVSENAGAAAALLGILTVLTSVALGSIGLLVGIIVFVVLTGLFEPKREPQLATKVLLVASIPLLIRNLVTATLVGSGLIDTPQITAVGQVDAAIVTQFVLLFWLTRRVLGLGWLANFVSSAITVFGGAALELVI